MRITVTSIVRNSLKAGSMALFCLLSASAVQAAPAPARTAAGPTCDPQTTTLRKLPRHPKSFGGPVAPPAARSLYGLTDVTARIKRGTRVTLGTRLVAISSGPDARTDSDPRPVHSLQRLGEFLGTADRRPSSRDFSPKSPRGPPAAA
jgi:hypothetical protein